MSHIQNFFDINNFLVCVVGYVYFIVTIHIAYEIKSRDKDIIKKIKDIE